MNKGKSGISFATSNTTTESASIFRGYVSCNSVLHSDEGEYSNNGERHISGGHGQTSIDYLEKNQIDYEINKEYNNGVRVGNILNSKQKYSRSGNNHTWFPKEWSIADIREAGELITSKYSNQKIKDGEKRTITFKNVKVVGIYNKGEITTLFPHKNQNGGVKYDK